jgi:hypothetical protein
MSNTTAFTISGWLNLQSIPGSGSISAITVLGSAGNYVAVSYFNNYTMNSIVYNGLMFFFYNASSVPVVVGNFPNVSTNTWYNFTYIFSATGTCYAYINGTLVGSVAGQTLLGSLTTYSIGCGVSNTAQAFNGYIDDYRIYNGAVAFSPINSMNWAYTAVSGSGQYMLAAATGGGLFMSSNYGVSWSQVTTSVTNPLYTGLSISNSGQYMLAVGGNVITPQQSGLAAASWTQGGVSWTTSASSQYSTFAPQSAFNSSTATTWASNSGTYNGSGAWTGSVAATTIQGVGSISGEWLQLQSNVGLLMQSYTFSCGGPVNQTPKTYYIIGSNDGTTWFPIQYVSMGSNPYTTNYSTASTYITTNQSGSQNLVVGASTAVLTCTTYSTTVNTYTYFRILVTTTHGGGVVEIGEWYINFANGQNYSTNYGSTWTKASINGATQTFGALSGNGQYTLTGSGQIAYLVSNYLGGFGTNTYTTLTLSGINANINCASISSTGQYMTILTQGTTNNVYYSTNYGVTFTALTVGAAAMTSCAISADGSYITVSNATTVYTLNRNTQGFGISIGNAAGAVNQGQNAIAIGNQAGVTNQSANSIVLNSSGSTLDTYNSGFYVSNISDYGTSYAPSFSLLGYGSDKQIVQGGITLSPSGYVGIGTTAPSGLFSIYAAYTASGIWPADGVTFMTTNGSISWSLGKIIGYVFANAGTANAYPGGLAFQTKNPDGATGTITTKMVIDANGNVGIGTATPGQPLHVYSSNGGILSLEQSSTGSNYISFLSNGQARAYIGLETSTGIGLFGSGTGYGLSMGTNANGGGLVAFSVLNVIRMNVGTAATAPFVDNTYACGYGSNRWTYVYAVNGTIQTSDPSRKVITPLPYGLAELVQVNPIKYKWKDEFVPKLSQSDIDNDLLGAYQDMSSFEYYGVNADEVHGIFPELVYHENSEHDKGINYGELVPVCINAIKELHTANQSMASQLATLEAANNALNSQLSVLLARLSAAGI